MSAASSAPHPWLSPRNLLWASVAVAVVTIALKTLAWVVTGSVGLLSDAMESLQALTHEEKRAAHQAAGARCLRWPW